MLCLRYSIGKMQPKTWKLAVEIYADLWKKRFTIGEMDILIAAFCIENNYTLVTANIKDFENIDGLKFVNWV